MSNTTTGWVILLAAVGMMFALLSVDIAALDTWEKVKTPVFVGTTIGHIAAVIGAFVGGKLIPTERDPSARDRISDAGLKDINFQENKKS